MPTGDWETDAAPSLATMAGGESNTVPFHIVAEGNCWLKLDDAKSELEQGDVVAFPFGTGHQLGAGSGGRLVTPVKDLPPKPWREIPVLRYGQEATRVRLLCGYLQCDALNFRPLRDCLPSLLHVKTRASNECYWLRATVEQLVNEVDQPRTGGLSMLERLTEVMFIELLRHRIITAGSRSLGWLTALADPSLGRCLSVIHENPAHRWSVPELSVIAGLSRSTLTERFEAMLNVSPMRYVREWRLYLSSVELSSTRKPVARIAYEAGYGTEAAFNRAFSRTFGAPPATWRQNAKKGL